MVGTTLAIYPPTVETVLRTRLRIKCSGLTRTSFTNMTSVTVGITRSSSKTLKRLKTNHGAGKQVSAEQMEIARLRAELARVKMERDILGKATAYFAKGAV